MKRTTIFLLGSFLGCTIPARANLVINATFDSSFSSRAEQAVVNNAISVYESTFTNDITVGIYFQAFTGSVGLVGQSNVGSAYLASYKDFYDGLVRNNANPTALDTLRNDGGDADTNGGVDPAIHYSRIQVFSANLRALGFYAPGFCIVAASDPALTALSNAPNHCAGSGPGQLVDGIITLNTFITDPPRTPQSSSYSLLVAVEHEIDEILGLGSSLPNVSVPVGWNPNTVPVIATRLSPEDLWRYTANGSRASFNYTCGSVPGSAVFSITGSGSGDGFNNSCNGADWGDWDSASSRVQNAFLPSGTGATLGNSEINALTAIGYNAAAPEPGTFTLLFVGATLLGMVRLKRMWRGSMQWKPTLK